MSEMLGHLIMMYKLGIKTGYYFNSNDQAGEIDVPDLVSSEVDDAQCDSCAI
jgi:hypothetical protein